jgi:aminoglycoside phosphotransferase (APT) family kinase protein
VLADPSPETVAAAVRGVAPELSGLPVVVRDVAGRDDPLWQAGSARIGDGFFVKFAWSEVAAARVAHEIAVLTALTDVPFLPEIVAVGIDPVLLVTRRVVGTSLFHAVGGLDLDDAGRQLALFLTALHGTSIGALPSAYDGVQHPVGTDLIRERFDRWVSPPRARIVDGLCDRIDSALAGPSSAHVVAHADFHGDNQIWDGGLLRLVVDFETVALAEPEYDLRALPGTGPGIDLLLAVLRHYTGRRLDADRVLAWHARSALNDALWRCEAGIALPDGRTPSEWVDDLVFRWNLAS